VLGLSNRRRRFAFVIAILIGVPLAAVVAVALFDVAIDASRWRDMAAQRAAAALGRPVVLDGAFELRLGREPGFRIGHVQILNPPGFTGREFLAIGELRAHVDLLGALRGRLRLRHIEASDVDLWLERAADGRGNWTSTVQGDATVSQAGIDIDQVTLQRMGVRYHDARSATHRVIELDQLSATIGRDTPLRLAARGRMEPLLPSLSLRVEGGPLRLLLEDVEPWPFTLDLKTQGARLHASGALAAGQRTAGFRFDAHADDPAPIERLLGAKLPHLGRAALHGTVSVEADAVRVTELHGWLGESEVSGQLALAFGGVRPRLSGALSAAALDLRPWIAAQTDAQVRGADGDAAAQQTLPLRDLSAVDVEVDLKVERWFGPSVDIRDASFELRADRQGVRVPMGATLAGIPFVGVLELDTAAPIPTFELQLGANNAVIGELAQSLGYANGIEGRFGRFDLRIGGRGETLELLARDLELSLAAAAAQLRFGNAAGGRPIAVSLDKLELAVRRGDRLRGQARGTLLGERASLTFLGGSVDSMLREQVMPFELQMALAQARLRVDGTLPLHGATRETALRFDLQAHRAGDLARWLPVAPESDLAVSLRGQMRMADEGWSLDAATLQLGRSELTIAARRTLVEGRSILMATVRSPLIDVQQLSTLRAGSDGRSRRGAPIFPAAFYFVDADVDLSLQHVLFGRTDLADVAFVARTRDARLWPTSVTGKVAGAPFTASVELDLHGERPMASLDLSTGAIDLGGLLRGLGVAEDIDGIAQAVHLKLVGRGNTLHGLADHSDLDVRVRGGSITVLGAAQRPLADIRIDEARIGAMAGEPVRLRLDGALDQMPVRIDLKSGTFGDFARDATRVPFALAAQAAGARLTLDGDVTLPLGRGGQLSFEMSGERLDTLSDLARVELPAWGPWSFRGPIRMTPAGYELQGLQVAVGRSRLSGSGKLDLSGPRPYLEVQVAAPSIQIDDFPPPQRLTESPAQPGDGGDLRGAASRFAGRTDKLLGAAFLRRLDASIDVKAKEVLSGSDRLADGALHLELRNGRLKLDPVVVNLPGGALRLSISYDLKESEVDFAAAAYVERFDYGIIARRLNRADDLRGLFSLNLEIAGTAPSLDTIMRNANGRMDFAVWPTELRSGMFNLWSANLVLTLLPLIDPGAKSQVNCIVGRFDLRDGDLADDKIMIDTSTVRIRGTGNANLATEKLAFVFRPRAKGIGLLRLQTPLRVGGTLTDQRFYFTQADVLESVLRLIASPVLLPIEWLTRGPMPRDGSDVCMDPLRALAR
jgi:uncharacterized protein involved in outer membrane biogenesis